jgi:ankyrin repeat protein
MKSRGELTALHHAALHGHDLVVQLLMEEGADLETKTESGWTALHFAAFHGDQTVVQLLLDEGADVEAKTEWRETALHVTSLQNHAEVIRLIIDKGGSPTAQDIRGRTPLHIAALEGASENVDILLKYCDSQLVDRNGWTPALVAARCGHEEVSKRLQRYKLDLPQILPPFPRGWSPDDKAYPLILTDENLTVEYPGKNIYVFK